MSWAFLWFAVLIGADMVWTEAFIHLGDPPK
jgi:hypothetical protein